MLPPSRREPALSSKSPDRFPRRRRGGEDNSPSFVTVGQIVGAFGVAGDVKVDLQTDFPERFTSGNRLYLMGAPVTIEHARGAGPERLVVKLSGVETREQAAALRGASLEIPEEEVAPLPDGSYYRFQLMGLEAWSAEGEFLGVVADIFPTGSNDVLVVRRPEHPELLVPNTQELTDIDLTARRITVRVVPGLFSEEGGPGPRTPAKVKKE